MRDGVEAFDILLHLGGVLVRQLLAAQVFHPSAERRERRAQLVRRLLGQAHPDAVLLGSARRAEEVVAHHQQHYGYEEVEQRHPSQRAQQGSGGVVDISRPAVGHGYLYRLVVEAFLKVEVRHRRRVYVAVRQHRGAAAVDDDHRHQHRVLRNVRQERHGEARQHLAQLRVVLRLLVVQRHRHTPDTVAERRVLRVFLQQAAFKLLSRQLLRHGDDRVARLGDDDRRVAAVDNIVDVCETELEVHAQVGVVERLQYVGVELHLAVLVEGGLLEEVCRGGSHLVALAYGGSPEAHLGLLALSHLVGDALHLPQSQQRQPYGQCQHYQFQSLFHIKKLLTHNS